MKSLLIFLLTVGLILFSSTAIAATFLYFNSEPGDYIGLGVEQTWTTEDGIFTASRNFDNGVSIFFNGSDKWNLDFAGPNGQLLQPGPYENATRFPFQSPTGPGLSVYGDGRGCNTLTGRFDIIEVVYSSSGEVIRFAADFEQYCEGGTPALFGSVRLNATIGFEPKVYVKANGSHTPIIVNVGDVVEVAISMEAGDKEGTIVEKWLGVLSPYSNQWYNGKKWVASLSPRKWTTGPITTFEETFQWTFTRPGVYVFVFSSDKYLNGVLGTQYVDQVVVTVK